MTGLHQYMGLAQVHPGMILSDELLDVQGHVLLPSGTVLSAAMLASLPHHGIDMLPILLQATRSDQEVACEQQQQSQRLAYLFRKHDPADASEHATGELHRLMLAFRLSPKVPQ
jgi:hypothetical protein